MAQESQKTSLNTKVGKLLGDQITSSLFSFAFGSSFVMGALATVTGILQGMPLTWLIFAVTGIMAFTSVALNNIRKYAMATSVAEKFQFAAVTVAPAEHKDKGETGNGVGITFVNLADVPLAFRIERSHVHLDGRVPLPAEDEVEGIVPPGMPAQIMLGLVPGKLPPNDTAKGGLECVVTFGRVGKRRHSRTHKIRLAVNTGPNGEPFVTTPYAA